MAVRIKDDDNGPHPVHPVQVRYRLGFLGLFVPLTLLAPVPHPADSHRGDSRLIQGQGFLFPFADYQMSIARQVNRRRKVKPGSGRSSLSCGMKAALRYPRGRRRSGRRGKRKAGVERYAETKYLRYPIPDKKLMRKGGEKLVEEA